jgi:putative Holliday junction resolvase
MQFNINELKNSIKNKKILAIDYGEKRVGLASTDIFHITFNPITTLQNDEKLESKINQIIQKENIQVVIMGFPYRNNSSESIIHQKINDFKESLSTQLNIPIYLFDESGSSKQAMQNLVNSGISKKSRRNKQDFDKFAAVVILQNFINEIEGENYV